MDPGVDSSIPNNWNQK